MGCKRTESLCAMSNNALLTPCPTIIDDKLIRPVSQHRQEGGPCGLSSPTATGISGRWLGTFFIKFEVVD